MFQKRLFLYFDNTFKQISKGGVMKRIASVLILLTSTVLFAQDTFNNHSIVNPSLSNSTMWPSPTSGVRGVWSGSDLDKDGRMEVWATDYDAGGGIHAFEWYYGDTLVHVWSSDSSKTVYGSGTRWIQTGDLDGDGLGEVIFFAGRYNNSDTLAGLYVYEWDGATDNGYTTKWHRNLHTAFADTMQEVRVEHFSVGDIDSDGKDEIIWANNGPSNPAYGTTATDHAAYSGDRFIIASVSGDIGVLPQLVEEYAVSPRDADKDGVRENKFGGGSPQGVVIADTDGDGKKEAWCFSWNNLSAFSIEATGADAYAVSDTGYKMVTLRDEWTLAPAVADVDKDGKDEVYVPGWYTGIVYAIADKDGDATTFLSTEYAAIDSLGTAWASNGKGNVYAYGAAASNNAFGEPAVFVAHGKGFAKYDFSGTNVLDEDSWTKTESPVDTLQTGAATKLYAGANIDRDGFGEVIIGYQSVTDSMYAGTDTAKANPNRTFVRVLEWTGKSTTLDVRDVVLITPDDYKLSQNYPNPFNPTTTIEYTLPIASQLSISIFNVMGQEVANVLPLQDKPAGTYRVNWNGLDRSGNQVASGTYFYTMRFGNFTKTKQMTFMK